MFAARAARVASLGVRSYASEAAVTLPNVQLNGLAGKYAGALFTAAAKKSPAALKAVETDLTGVAALIKKDTKIQDFLANPILSKTDKSKGIDSLLSSASKSPNEITKNFFEVLAENGRLYEADKVITDFLEIMSAHRGEVKVTITTAAPLDADLQKRLEKALQGSVAAGQGKSLIIENKVSEHVLGGLIVDFGDKSVDLSVASKVNKLNAQIAESI